MKFFAWDQEFSNRLFDWYISVSWVVVIENIHLCIRDQFVLRKIQIKLLESFRNFYKICIILKKTLLVGFSWRRILYQLLKMSYLKVGSTHIDNNYHTLVRRGSLKSHRQSLPTAESLHFISARASAAGRLLHSGNTETTACPGQSRDFRTVLTLAYLLFPFLKPPRPLRPPPSSENIKYKN